MTLLEIVQSILNQMDSDQVNSIDETTEAEQVAQFVKETYNFLTSHIDFPEHFTFFELVASGDVTQPVLMTLPTNCLELVNLYYNNYDSNGDDISDYVQVKYKPLNEFLEMQNSLDLSASEVFNMSFTTNSETFEVKYRNDIDPEWYTTFDDFTLLFNAYDATVDSTLQKAKTRCYGKLSQTFTLSDSFTPDLDANMFSLLLNEASTQCFENLKQQANQTAMRRARKGWVKSQNKKHNIYNGDPYDYYPNYGRK